MSLYTECSAALRELAANPPDRHGGVFTEIDVVNKAGKPGWSTANYKEALRHANNLMGSQYSSRKLCRYGPVKLPNGREDYARIASKVVYANAVTGPLEWATPNGTFSKLMVEDDNLRRPGRKYNTHRNDLAAWNVQDLSGVESVDAATAEPEPASADLPVDVTALEREIAQLRANLAHMTRRAEEAEAERDRLRDQIASMPVGEYDTAARIREIAEAAALEVVGDLENRVSSLSGRFERLQGALAA